MNITSTFQRFNVRRLRRILHYVRRPFAINSFQIEKIPRELGPGPWRNMAPMKCSEPASWRGGIISRHQRPLNPRTLHLANVIVTIRYNSIHGFVSTRLPGRYNRFMVN